MESKEKVQEFFGRHAAAYSASPGHRRGPDLDLLIRLLGPSIGESLLDVATATGNTALAFAPFVDHVTGLDLTPEMEPEFTAQAKERGVTNARFILGDVDNLPFAEGTFDLVTCRRAAHHFPQIPLAVAEMARVLKGGGRLGLVDMTAPDDARGAKLFNDLERARDSSHNQAFSPLEWRRAVEGAGLQVQHLEIMGDEIPFPRWLSPVAADGSEAQGAAALARSAPPEVAESVVKQEPDGTLFFRKRWIILVAVKP